MSVTIIMIQIAIAMLITSIRFWLSLSDSQVRESLTDLYPVSIYIIYIMIAVATGLVM